MNVSDMVLDEEYEVDGGKVKRTMFSDETWLFVDRLDGLGWVPYGKIEAE